MEAGGTAAAAQQMPIPGGENVPVVETSVQKLTLRELTHVWTLGVGSDRSLGRPKERNGEPEGFDDFAFKFANWLSGFPGDAEWFLEESANMGQLIVWGSLEPRGKSLVGGKTSGRPSRHRQGPSTCPFCHDTDGSLMHHLSVILKMSGFTPY